MIAGGGPGVMEAANRGARDIDGAVSVGLGIELPFEQRMNDYVDLGIEFRYFFVRKTMFVSTRAASSPCPRASARWTSCSRRSRWCRTHKVTSFPVVLMGSEFWGGLLDWIKGSLLSTRRSRRRTST
ncbi:hypothetical protein GCM10020220_094350 [Nonomuraea rubra]